MSKYQVGIASAVLGFIGTLLVYYSFQAASTPFLLVVNRDGKAYLCVGDRALFSMNSHGGMGFGEGCGDTTNARPAAVVNMEHQWAGYLRLVVILLSFVFQALSMEKPRPETTHRSFGPRQRSPNSQQPTNP